MLVNNKPHQSNDKEKQKELAQKTITFKSIPTGTATQKSEEYLFDSLSDFGDQDDFL